MKLFQECSQGFKKEVEIARYGMLSVGLQLVWNGREQELHEIALGVQLMALNKEVEIARYGMLSVGLQLVWNGREQELQ